MLRNSEATESSRTWASVQGTLGSTESHPADTTNRSDSSSSPHATGNGSEFRETATPTVLSPLTPPIPPPPPPPSPPLPSTLAWPASLMRGSPEGPTYGTQVRVDELSGNKAQSAYPPSDASRLHVPVRRPTQSQPSIQGQSTTIYPPVSQKGFTPVSHTNSANSAVYLQGSQQLPFQYSQESYRVPNTHTPQTYSSRNYGDIPASRPGAPQIPYQTNPPQTFPSSRSQQYVTPLRQNTPNTPFTYPGTSFQPYEPQGPQTYYSGPIRPFAQSAPPQSFGPTSPPISIKGGTFSGTSHAPDFGRVPSPQPLSSGPHVPPRPNARSPQVQSMGEGTPQQYVPQSAPPQGGTFNSYTPGFGHVPPRPSSLSGYNPATRVVQPQTRRKVDAFVASDPFRLGVSHGDDKIDELSNGLTFDDIPTPESDPGFKFPQGMASGPYEILASKPTSGGNILHSQAYEPSHSFFRPPPSNVPAPQIPLRRPSWTPEVRIQPQVRPGRPEPDDAPEQADSLPLPSMQSKPPMSWPPMQSQTPVGSPVPSTQPKPDDPQDFLDYIPSDRHELQAPTDESSFASPTSAFHHLGYPLYPQHHSQYPELPKDSFFSRFTRFFQWSHHTRHESEFTKVALRFVLVTLPVQMYLHFFLLRLPSLYFSRVARIFEEADMTLPQIKEMALETASQGLKHEFEIQMAFESPSVPPAYKRLKSTWEFFIDSVMREWKTFNIISVLLLTAILTVLQIQSAAEDPLTRYTALLSLMCSLMSLLFGCMYIIRFGTMRKTYKAAEWALEAKRTKTLVCWNVWVMLAIPAIWLTWSIILYIACIMSFVWRSTVTGTTTPPGISDAGLLVIRIVITVVLVIGVLYGFLIMATFRRYGVVMDKAWKQRIDRWIEEKTPGNNGLFGQPLFDNPQYPSMPYAYPNGSTMYQQPTYKPSRYYQPSFGDPHGGYTRNIDDPAHASDAYVPPPEPYLTPTHSLHSQLSTDTGIPNQSSNLQNDDNNMASAVYNPSPGTTPPPLPPKVPITSVEETPPRLNWKKPHLAVPPPPSLPPIPGTPTPPFADTLSKDKVNELGSSSSHDELMMVPKTLAVSCPSLLPIPCTFMTPFTDQSSKGNNNVLESSSESSGQESKVGGDNDVR